MLGLFLILVRLFLVCITQLLGAVSISLLVGHILINDLSNGWFASELSVVVYAPWADLVDDLLLERISLNS